MRTTLTLDPDVVRLIEGAIHEERRPMKQVVNDALRRGLAPRTAERAEPFRLVAHESAIRPGYDLAGFNRLADELADESFVDRTRSAS